MLTVSRKTASPCHWHRCQVRVMPMIATLAGIVGKFIATDCCQRLTEIANRSQAAMSLSCRSDSRCDLDMLCRERRRLPGVHQLKRLEPVAKPCFQQSRHWVTRHFREASTVLKLVLVNPQRSVSPPLIQFSQKSSKLCTPMRRGRFRKLRRRVNPTRVR